MTTVDFDAELALAAVSAMIEDVEELRDIYGQKIVSKLSLDLELLVEMLGGKVDLSGQDSTTYPVEI